MTISAKIIAASVAEGCPPIYTVECVFPRFILPEVLTHRSFSRNTSSSRAIPVERMIDAVMNDPARPIHWGANKTGMQAEEELDCFEKEMCKWAWMSALDMAVDSAKHMQKHGAHKQLTNRLLEPFAHTRMLITATDWDNFFALRDHPDAQPEIQELARCIKTAIRSADPVFLKPHWWHTPYADNDDPQISWSVSKKISAARCASVSYKTVEGNPMIIDKALSICDKLMGDPLHSSPFEHVSKPCPENDKRKTRNFTGWAQYRAELEG